MQETQMTSHQTLLGCQLWHAAEGWIGTLTYWDGDGLRPKVHDTDSDPFETPQEAWAWVKAGLDAGDYELVSWVTTPYGKDG